MSTYVIGDIHGCFNQFINLLNKINYKKDVDKIILVGDLVNRGPDSLSVLNFCMADSNITTVLGNHDLYLLYLLSIDKAKGKLKEVVESNNNKKIFEWLKNKPFFIEFFEQSSKKTFYITHAGIPEIWSPTKAKQLATETSLILKKEPAKMLEIMWGDEPNRWEDKLDGQDRYRIIINYLTRMRFVGDNCILDMKNKGLKSSRGYKPWFNYKSKSHEKNKEYYIFGHWAALNGRTRNDHFIGLDTGCVWGNKLTAIRLEDKKLFQVEAK
tara:strand:+ start:3636 stop:4442 length:807 start_codon:yes stop_codon:yes gene_type:complete